jgi:autotransporter-associated beta strand protein
MQSSWFHRLTRIPLGRGRNSRPPSSQRKAKPRRWNSLPRLETLEERLNPNTGLSLVGTVLTINVDPGETAILSLASGNQISVTDNTAGALVTADANAVITLGFAASTSNSNTSNDPGGLASDTTNVASVVVTSNGAGGGRVQIGAGNASVFNSAWQLTVSNSGGASGTFDLGGNNLIVGGLTGGGVVTNSGGTDAVLTVGAGNTAFGGTIQDGTIAHTGLTVSGAGTILTLTGSNSYSNVTTIFSGATLRPGASGGTSPNSVVEGGGTLDLNDTSGAAIGGLQGGLVTNNAANGTGLLESTGNVTFNGLISDGTSAKTAVTVVSGTLTMMGGTASNSYSGLTDILSGATLKAGMFGFNLISTVQVESGGTLDLGGNNAGVGGLTGTGMVTNSESSDAALSVGGGNTTFGGTIQDGTIAHTGLSVSGAGTILTLTGSNSYSNVTTIFSGATLRPGASGGTSPNSVVEGGGTLDLNDSSGAAIGGLQGGLVTNNAASGTGVLESTGNVTFNGLISDGTSAKTAVTVVNGTLTMMGGSASNSYSGLTDILSGATLKAGMFGFNLIATVQVESGGTLDLGGNNAGVGGLTGTGIVTNSGSSDAALTVGGGNTTFAGTIQDGTMAHTGLTVSGTGTILTLTGSNSYSDVTTIFSGAMLRPGASGGTSPSSVVEGGGTLDLNDTSGAAIGGLQGGFVTNNAANGTGVLESTGNVTFNGLISDGTSARTAVTVVSGTLTMMGGTASNSYSGLTDILSGATLKAGMFGLNLIATVQVESGGTLDLGGKNAGVGGLTGIGIVTNSSTVPAALTVTASGTDTFAGTLQDGAVNEKLALTVNGTGILALIGTSTYSGSTTVMGGTLEVDGSIASDVTLSGGTLSGDGTVGTVAGTGGGVAPGDGATPGILTTGALSLPAGTSYTVTGIGGNTAGDGSSSYAQDHVTSGTMTLGGTLNLPTSGSYTPQADDVYSIINNVTANNAITGNFVAGTGITSVSPGMTLAEGTILSTNFLNSGLSAHITYLAGTNGDNVAIVIAAPTLATSTSVVDTPNPSLFGQQVTFTATVTNTSGSGGMPTGSVQFQVDGAGYGTPIILDANGQASTTDSALALGTHTITAPLRRALSKGS